MSRGRLYTATEAALELGVCRAQVHRLLQSGRLKGYMIGTGRAARWTIPERAIFDYRRKNSVPSA